ncbi:diiron oxygenase [Actinomadura fulvescens]|uniref:diiron oxygenase n=1 Tax=Actinomadura fulvescens TaxID=46160 RepID=UPI0031E44AFA
MRTGPRRLLGDELGTGRLFFPPDLVPYWDHPRVRELPERTRGEILARHLFHYLEFTTHFETRVVNRATDRIAGGRCGIDVDPETRLNAYRIYCDEGYHSLCSLDVIAQVSAASAVAVVPYDFEPFLTRLDQVGQRALPDAPALAQLLQVVVFETLITAILKDIPQNPRVLTIVRDTVREHAKDEGWHHVFFSQFFRELWAQQSRASRRRISRCLPGLIRSSLLPEQAPVRASLTRAGLGAEAVEEIMRDTYSHERVNTGIRAASRHTMRLFEETGVLGVPGASDAFAAAELLS